MLHRPAPRQVPPETDGAGVLHPCYRVLLFVDNFQRHGTQLQVVNLANALERDGGFRVYVGCLKLRGDLLDALQLPAGRVMEYPLRRFYDASGARQAMRLAAHVRRRRIDLVHAHDFYANVLCTAATAWMPGCRLVVSRRYEVLSRRRVHRLGERVCYRLADAVVTNSARIAGWMADQRLVAGSKVVVIPNGLDLGRFLVEPNGFASKGRGPSAPRCIGVVARLAPEKGHATLLEAVAKLRSSDCPSLELLVIGDGELRGHLESEVGRLGLTGQVTFVGEQADVRPWLRRLEVAALPSHWGEGLPNSVLECLAMGVPVVATTSGGTPELIRDGQEGFLVPPRDADGLAAAIARLLRDERLRRSMSEAARRRADHYSLEKMVEATKGLYLRLLGHGGVVDPPDADDRGAPAAPKRR